MLIDFAKYRYLFFVISLAFLGPGFLSLLLVGVKPAIDFTGGAVLELRFVSEQIKPPRDTLQNILQEKKIEYSSLQSSGVNQFLLRTKPLAEQDKAALIKIIEDKFGRVDELRFETLGPTIGREVLLKALVALLLGFLFIFAYIVYQFHDIAFGAAAMLATLHDTLVILGSASLLGRFLGMEVDTLFVTALLTSLSFSVHDTVVVYDRIRESAKHFPQTSLAELVNKASNETLVRSLNNSLTVLFMLAALILLGGATLRWFSLMLFIGTVTGTYSSTCTAAPLLVVWQEIRRKFLSR